MQEEISESPNEAVPKKKKSKELKVTRQSDQTETTQYYAGVASHEESADCSNLLDWKFSRKVSKMNPAINALECVKHKATFRTAFSKTDDSNRLDFARRLHAANCLRFCIFK